MGQLVGFDQNLRLEQFAAVIFVVSWRDFSRENSVDVF